MTLLGENDKWQASLDRVIGVIIGCACALAVGFLFDKISNLAKLHPKDGPEKPGQQE